jgi:DNA repair ATPase RecN
LLAFPLALAAQNGSSSAGVPPEWDVRPMIQSVTAAAERLKPLLDQLEPKKWVAQGASETYVTQWQSAQSELTYLVNTAKRLAQEPDRLTLALELYFRWQAIESTVHSLEGGIRRYQNPALADVLNGVVSENVAQRDRLRQYVQQLAEEREQEWRVMDSEAQRCRETLNRGTGSRPAPRKRPEVK